MQLGDGTGFNRNTPVAVVGLSSGVAMVASGDVRLFDTCCVAVACVRAGDVKLIDWGLLTRLRVLMLREVHMLLVRRS